MSKRLTYLLVFIGLYGCSDPVTPETKHDREAKALAFFTTLYPEAKTITVQCCYSYNNNWACTGRVVLPNGKDMLISCLCDEGCHLDK